MFKDDFLQKRREGHISLRFSARLRCLWFVNQLVPAVVNEVIWGAWLKGVCVCV